MATARTLALLVLSAALTSSCSGTKDVPVKGVAAADAAADALWIDSQLSNLKSDVAAVKDAAAQPDAASDQTSAPELDVVAPFDAAPTAGLWWRQFGVAKSPLRLGPVAVDSQGRVIVTGGCNSPVDMGIAVTQTGTGFAFLFAAAYAPDGTPLWARRFGMSSSHSAITAVAIGASDQIYLTGHFQGGPLDFGSGPLANAAGSSNNTTDIFVAALNPNGEALWALRTGGDSWDFAGGLAVAADGHVVAAAQVSGHLQVLWLEPGGALQQTVTSPGYVSINAAFKSVVNHVAIDAAHNAYVVGTVSGAPTDWGAGATAKSKFQQGFVLSYAAAGGALRWSQMIPTTVGNSVVGSGASVRSIVVAGDGLVVAGDFPGQIELGGGALTAGTTHGQISGFVERLRAADGGHIWSYGLGDGSSIRGLALAASGDPVVAVVASKPVVFPGLALSTLGAHLVAVDALTGAALQDRDLADIAPAAVWAKNRLAAVAAGPNGEWLLPVGLVSAQKYGFAALVPIYSDGLIVRLIDRMGA